MANKTFTSESFENRNKKEEQSLGSYYKNSRVNLLTKDIASDFNTYRNWKEFDLVLPKIWDDNGNRKDVVQPKGKGIKSLFSNSAAVYTDSPIREQLNIPLLDSPANREKIRKNTGCTIKELVETSQSGAMGRSLYNYSDFMYCKYLGKVPNNYMITLRKFPMPCSDHINFSFPEESKYNKHLPDIGRLITWMGTPGNEMSNILSYDYSMPWQKDEAPFEETPEQVGGADPGKGLGGLMSLIDNTYAKDLASSQGYGYGDNVWANRLGGNIGATQRNADLKDNNRDISYTQNMISSVMTPGGKEGLTFNHEIKLTFDYELRSYDGINGRSAMLDLLANILMVTYLQGYFFPGSYRQSNASQSNAYANLDIFTRDIHSPSDLFDSIAKSGQQLWAGIPGDDVISKLKNIAGNIFNVFQAGMINKLGRPAKYAMTSLITPSPTGQWHLTVGNPRNPIISIGNLIMKNAKIEHYGPLGLDDFPTGLKVEVTLEHAKPRDSVAIEMMYMHGDNRIYCPVGEDGVFNMYGEESSSYNTVTKKGTTNQSITGIDVDKTTDELQKFAKNPVKTSVNIYKKYFTTDENKSILHAVGEALTGARKAK